MKVLFDASVLVAALLHEHPSHEPAAQWLRRAKKKEIAGCISAHTLAELYAVLTALPASPRISPMSAHRLIDQNVLSHMEIVALTAEDYKAVVSEAVNYGVSGGAVYDAIIARAAIQGHAKRLLTLNAQHFRRFGPKVEALVSEP